MAQRSAQQCERAERGEAARHERVLFGDRERRGDDALVAVRSEAGDDFGDGGAVEMLVDERGHRCRGAVVTPRPDPDRAAAGDRQILHRRRSLEATSTGSDGTER